MSEVVSLPPALTWMVPSDRRLISFRVLLIAAKNIRSLGRKSFDTVAPYRIKAVTSVREPEIRETLVRSEREKRWPIRSSSVELPSLVTEKTKRITPLRGTRENNVC